MLFMDIGGRAIEYRVIPGPVSDRPTLVFLHEGLGSAGLWREFPQRLAEAAGRRALIYSRADHGFSDIPPRPRTPRFMHEEALDVLPAILDRAGIDRPLLIGHSDGASIALIHAASTGRPVAGLVLMAPHIMVEPICVESIARISATYAEGPLRSRLARYHAHVDDAFHGSADTWLMPEFLDWSLETEARALSIPTLLIQGRDDEYGTLAQIDRIAELAQGPVEKLVLEKCGHSPYRDQEAAVLAAIADFAARHFPGNAT